MNDTTMIKKFKVSSKDHSKISEILDELPNCNFVRKAILEKIYENWKIKNLDDEFQDMLIEFEKEENHHYSENGDFFAYFEDEDVDVYLPTYEEEFVEYFKNNIDLCYDR
jgi:hypothetical protein